MDPKEDRTSLISFGVAQSQIAFRSAFVGVMPPLQICCPRNSTDVLKISDLANAPYAFSKLFGDVQHGLVDWQNKLGHCRGKPRRICPSTHQGDRSSYS